MAGETGYAIGSLCRVECAMGLRHDVTHRATDDVRLRYYTACGLVFLDCVELTEPSNCVQCVCAPPPRIWI